MSRTRYEMDMYSSFAQMVSGLASAHLDADHDPNDLAQTLERVARRLRHDADEVPTQLTVERYSPVGPVEYRVVTADGEEVLFPGFDDVVEYLEGELEVEA